MKIKIGTRGSKLALAQTNIVIEGLRAAYPNHEYEPVVIKTTGDMDLTRPLDQLGSKGLFVDEIERALLTGKIQLAVHSMKDMPDTPLKGLTFAKPMKREDARDVLILKEGNSLNDLKPGAKVATGSKRRSFQLLKLRPDLNIYPIRGNIDTRIRKLNDGLLDGTKLDGIVLAAAGIHRLNIKPEHIYYFDVEEMIPSPAQGTLAIEYKEGNALIEEMLEAIAHEETNEITLIERGFLKAVGGDCHLPIGAFAKKTTDTFKFYGLFGKEDGTKLAKTYVEGDDAGSIIAEAVADIRQKLEN